MKRYCYQGLPGP